MAASSTVSTISFSNLGAAVTLANNVAASANQVFQTDSLGFAKHLTVFLRASGATTFTINVSPDGVNWYPATLITGGAATFAPTGAGAISLALAPAPYVQVSTSAAVTVTIQAVVAL